MNIGFQKHKKEPYQYFFFRFEDLLMNPEPVLKDMFRFILAEENLENTIIEKRIKDVVGNGQN